MKQIKIAGRVIGDNCKPYIIAEMSGNHNGDINRAKELISAAKIAGADAVKLQTYTADTITIDHSGPEFFVSSGLWAGKTLYELYAEASTPWGWHAELFQYAKDLGITIFSSPFDSTAVDFLESLNTPAYKIASFELIDLALVRKVASTGKPLILSTGNASLAEIQEAVDAARESGATELVLLHCTSGYPTPPEEANIATMASLSSNFDCIVGLSDHTMGVGVSIAAVTLGAAVIEKHFTLARSDGGPDSAFSLEKDELAELVSSCRDAHTCIGKVNYVSTASELKTKVHRRSLYVVKDICAGEMLTAENIRSIRPGAGLKPKYYEEILGRKAAVDLPRGTPLFWGGVEPL